MGKRIAFVTGATGLVGSHLLYFLCKSGYGVLALRRETSRIKDVQSIFLQYPDGDELWRQVNWVEGDVLVKKTLEEPIASSSFVFHCAALVSFTPEDKHLLWKTNLEGTENIASLCLESGKRFCYVSSIAALGDARKEGEVVDEETPEISERLHSEYTYSKGDAEKIVWKYVSRGLDAVIVCPSIILGVGAADKSSSRLYTTAAKGIPFYTSGVCGYVDVRDVCCLMIRLAEDVGIKGERFVLNGGNYSYRELFTTIALVNNKRPPYLYLRSWMTEFMWRLLGWVGKLTGRKPAFTRETARTSQCKSYYSSAKILSRYSDFHFYPLTVTVQNIYEAGMRKVL